MENIHIIRTLNVFIRSIIMVDYIRHWWTSITFVYWCALPFKSELKGNECRNKLYYVSHSYTDSVFTQTVLLSPLSQYIKASETRTVDKES